MNKNKIIKFILQVRLGTYVCRVFRSVFLQDTLKFRNICQTKKVGDV